MCKWFYFYALCVAQQSFSILPSFLFHYILKFCTKKKIMYYFLFNSQETIAIILKLSQSPEAFQSFFYFWYNLYYLLHSLVGCVSVHWQMHNAVVMFLPPILHLLGREKLLHTWGELDACRRLDLFMFHSHYRKIQWQHLSTLLTYYKHKSKSIIF